MFYGAFFVVYGEALYYTSAARKTLGVAIAMGGVAIALATGLGEAPAGAWRGDLMMTAAMFSMALYNVLSRPLMARSSALGYATAGMAFGSGVNALTAWYGGGLQRCTSAPLLARSASTSGSMRLSAPHRREWRTPSL
jgi:drug/metabolite transporter (DMT)-like permease